VVKGATAQPLLRQFSKPGFNQVEPRRGSGCEVQVKTPIAVQPAFDAMVLLARGNVVTVKGERKVTTKSKEVNPIHEEIVYGGFERTFELPETVQAEKLTAEYHNGVLEITAPVTEAAFPRKIEIKTLPLVKRGAA
jgi:hypothetical protein